MTKEEKIKEAYGKFSDVAIEICNENGWIKLGEYYTYFPIDREISHCGCFERPKSLSGIENNNGWVKIESKEQLLKLDSENTGLNMFFVMHKYGHISIDSLGKVRTNRWVSAYTHYQPIHKPEPPIY